MTPLASWEIPGSQIEIVWLDYGGPLYLHTIGRTHYTRMVRSANYETLTEAQEAAQAFISELKT